MLPAMKTAILPLATYAAVVSAAAWDPLQHLGANSPWFPGKIVLSAKRYSLIIL
jgi:hypothetical protein